MYLLSWIEFLYALPKIIGALSFLSVIARDHAASARWLTDCLVATNAGLSSTADTTLLWCFASFGC